jgi:hypothetical protein
MMKDYLAEFSFVELIGLDEVLDTNLRSVLQCRLPETKDYHLLVFAVLRILKYHFNRNFRSFGTEKDFRRFEHLGTPHFYFYSIYNIYFVDS